ncbi:hypothetical protein DKG34_30070 [Streptomyces sp. NWU49]|nr:hypothetical protein DKG34_30070 [Streptomyces sp. NWU49]
MGWPWARFGREEWLRLPTARTAPWPMGVARARTARVSTVHAAEDVNRTKTRTATATPTQPPRALHGFSLCPPPPCCSSRHPRPVLQRGP